MVKQELAFPDSFIWGAATASYQIEGAVDEDGRGESIWDRFATVPGRVRGGDTGAIACDHYHRYREDIALMRNLGLRGYRFSIAWPRILPWGRGSVNAKGLDFYDRLVDELLASGIRPYATLYHWDLPQVLEDEGGWLNRATVDAYVDYVTAVTRRLGDRVKHWITHNEPWVAAWLGYGWGEHAPGKRGNAEPLTAAHHILVSHGQAVHAIRSEVPGARVGITLNLNPTYPASDSPEDCAAARQADGFANRWFLDPIFRGEYPADIIELCQDRLPSVETGDMATIATPIDFLGINNYSRSVLRAGPDGTAIFVRPQDSQYTDMDWEVFPEGLYDLLVRVHRDYAPKNIYITENGAAFPDVRTHDGEIHDLERCHYIESHLVSVAKAIAAGVPVAGHFVWSLLDNFEWQHGYSKRFGLIYVEYPTQQRVPKASYYWYRDFIRGDAARRARPASVAS
jgi:beta-glucosidase